MTLFALHLPDGFMAAPLALVGWILVAPWLAWALYQSREGDDHQTSLAGILAAFLFAAQTFHFPIPGGTSGHLVGGTLVVILCGPWLGLLTLTSVVVLQALVFGDGGLFTMGWNLTNMGLVSGFVGGAVYATLRKLKAAPFSSAFLAAWSATMLAALCTALELAAAQLTPLYVSLGAMLGVQTLMGLGEGLVTGATISFLSRVRPELLTDTNPASAGYPVAVLVGLATLCPPRLFGLETGDYPALLAYLALLAITLLVGGVLVFWSRR